MTGDISHGAEHRDKQRRCGNLKQKFLQGCQALVLLLFDLGIVIHHADQPKNQRQGKNQHRPEIGRRPNGGKACTQSTHQPGDEHDSAHGGSILLIHVPGRAILQDLLSEFQFFQKPDHRRSQHRREGKCHHKGADRCFHHSSSPNLSLSPRPVPSPQHGFARSGQMALRANAAFLILPWFALLFLLCSLRQNRLPLLPVRPGDA